MNVAIIQARLGSSRLPNKVLLKLGSKTVLEHVVSRVSKSSLIDEVFVVTTIGRKDLEIVKFCSHNDIRVFVGSEGDVLDRYYQCAKLLKPKNIIRITSDCPLIDPFIIDRVITLHIENNADYSSNTLIETYPDGQDIEVFRFSALEKAWREASLKSEREHVTPYIKKNGNIFNLHNVEYRINLSDKRWTIDNKEDYDFLKKIVESLEEENPDFTMDDILSLLLLNPEWELLNSHLVRNEGYIQSIKND